MEAAIIKQCPEASSSGFEVTKGGCCVANRVAAAESRLVARLPKILAGLVDARLLGGGEGTAGRGSFWVGDLEAPTPGTQAFRGEVQNNE